VGRSTKRPDELVAKKLFLVTGGSGFLGRRICALLLDQGYSVRSLARNYHKDMDAIGVEQCIGSITELSALKKAAKDCQAIIHTAALAGIWGQPSVYEEINVKGTENVVKACKEEGVKYLIYTSSPSVVFAGEDQIDIDESTDYPENYLCDYSRTKALAENLVLKSNSDQLKTISLRPHLIWGVGDNHLVPRLLESSEKGKLKIIGLGNNKVDMVHVDNAAWAHIDAYNALIKGVGEGTSYFITNDEPVEMWAWLNDLLSLLNKKNITKKVPVSFAYKLSQVFELFYKCLAIKKDPPLTRFVVRQLSTHHTYDISKAKSDLNYKIRTSMAEGLEKLVAHLKEKKDCKGL